VRIGKLAVTVRALVLSNPALYVQLYLQPQLVLKPENMRSVILHDLHFARSFGHRFGAGAARFGSAFRTRVPRPSGSELLTPRRLRVPLQKLLLLATRL